MPGRKIGQDPAMIEDGVRQRVQGEHAGLARIVARAQGADVPGSPGIDNAHGVLTRVA